MILFSLSALIFLLQVQPSDSLISSSRMRARQAGVVTGILTPGKWNAITDVAGVRVGHATLVQADNIRTGVTAVLPHPGNLYADKVPAAVVVGNGYGKLMGSTQIRELGEIETPIVLTNTLSVPRAGDAIIEWTLEYPGNEDVRSVNAVVGETNDGYLSDIRARVVKSEHVLSAIETARTGPVEEGAVGAGTGTVAFGWKGGIGTASRIVPGSTGNYVVGVLVQANFGGVLQIAGVPIGIELGSHFMTERPDGGDGSVIVVVATDAPLSDRNLERLARRALLGIGRTGSPMTNGSGDYVIAFSTALSNRLTPERRSAVSTMESVPNADMSPLFQAAVEATEEAVYNALFMAKTMSGFRDRTVEALPLASVLELLRSRGALEMGQQKTN